MARHGNPFYGININEIARICQVDITTARRWKRGASYPPKSALLLILGDLGAFDPAWRGWRVYDGTLVSPEGWVITQGDVLSSPLLRQQLAAFKSELRRMRAAQDSIHNQPLPSEWPEWIKDLQAG